MYRIAQSLSYIFVAILYKPLTAENSSLLNAKNDGKIQLDGTYFL